MIENSTLNIEIEAPPQNFVAEVLHDYETCVISREASLLGRRDVLTGKGKFGIFGDGKELAQVALAKFFKKGDWRSGYYRDQTLMFALGVSTPEQFFAQVYAHHEGDPFSGGRQMNAHFATPSVSVDTGEWTNHLDIYNQASDISSTGGQMSRAVGLALASRKYREINALRTGTPFSDSGNEVVFCTIGDASTSEGVFWESVNAAGVMRVPLAIFVWDDGYGISVPSKYQTTKGSISEVLSGFELNEDGDGINIYKVKGWDYTAMCQIFEDGIEKIRRTHIPAIFHVTELTQPQGHSTSGSHERYKSKERLAWEKAHDCNLKMREFILQNGIATEEELSALEEAAIKKTKDCRNRAWNAYFDTVKAEKAHFETLVSDLFAAYPDVLGAFQEELKMMREPFLSDMVKLGRKIKLTLAQIGIQSPDLEAWITAKHQTFEQRYSTHLYSDSPKAALNVPVMPPIFTENSEAKNGYEVINTFFDKVFEKYDNTFAFGEDVGHIGDVNQGFMGLQEKYGIERIFDAGIREWTIMGQAIGMAMRGLRPIAEIQYLDYLYYGLTPLVDDLTTLRYRSFGQQIAPAIIRTRGHRLEGIWHAGSPMGMMVSALRGMYICVPRNFVQAAGMYTTLLQSDDPAIVVEPLNSYRQKEVMPDNIGDYTVPLGVPEILHEGTDLTLVTYGACVRLALEAVHFVEKQGISVELIDIQTLLPFDLEKTIVHSLKKTNRIIFLDEDVPGGATAYMMQNVLEVQDGYRYLDATPMCITAKEHRPPYGSDGDYHSKPHTEDIIEAIIKIMGE